jgi:hypothetical protein
MRLTVACFLACVFVAIAPSLAGATPPSSLDVRAAQVDFYYDRYEVTADGNVTIRLSDGTMVRGDTFAMDVKLNRYVVAGNVRVDGRNVHLSGAALAGFLDVDKTYFLPETTATPQRWTFFGSDWSDPHAGRAQPGDTFYLPDTSGSKPYIRAQRVLIVPKNIASFTNLSIAPLGLSVPLPRYVVVFSANSNYFQNAFAGGRFDVGLPFAGSAHSLSALHLRNDPINGTYLAFDQHWVWGRDYVVFGIDPLTSPQRQVNLIGYKRWSPKFESRLFLQESMDAQEPDVTHDFGLIREPYNAGAFGELDLNAGLRHSGLSFTRDNYYGYLLGYYHPPDDNEYNSLPPFDPNWREHPTTTMLNWTGFENHLFSKYTPFLFRLRSGLGDAHDAYGEGGYPGLQPGPKDAFYHFGGGTLYTAPIKVGAYSFSTSYDRELERFNTPHLLDESDLRFSLGRPFERQHINAFLSYDVTHIADKWGALQAVEFPAAPNVVCNPGYGCFGGQDAFDGFSTLRGWTISGVWTPSNVFTADILAQRHYDFPVPVPGPPYGYGRVPEEVTLDVRIRLAKNILLDLSRTYEFGFGGNRWNPGSTFGVLP